MATIYWSYGGVNQDLADASNLWNDSAATDPYLGGTPGSGDDLIILGSTMPDDNSAITALASFDSSGADTGTSIGTADPTEDIVCPNVTVGVPGDNTSLHVWAGDLTSGASFIAHGASQYTGPSGVVAASLAMVFNDTSAFGSGDVEAASVTFNDDANFTGGTIGGSTAIVFNNDSYFGNSGTTSGAVTIVFNDDSYMASSPTVGCSTLTFNGSSEMQGGAVTASGTVTFGSPLVFTSGTIDAALTIFTALTGSKLDGGTINSGDVEFQGGVGVFASGTIATTGDVEFFNDATATGGTLGCGNLTLSSTSSLAGATVTATGDLTLNVSATVASGAIAIGGAATLNDSAAFTGGTIAITGDATLNDSASISVADVTAANATLNASAQLTSGSLSCGTASFYGTSSMVAAFSLTCSTGIEMPNNGITIGPVTAFTSAIALVEPDFPNEDNVRSGVAFADFTGNMTLPSEGDVRSGSGYGTDSTEFTGSLTLPAEEDVATGVQYGTDGTEFTGTAEAGGGGPILSRAFTGF